MRFGDLYLDFEPEVLFELSMNQMIFFQGTKNEFEKVKSKEYKGIEALKIESLSLVNHNENENIELPMIKIKIQNVSLFKLLQKGVDNEK